MHIALQTAERCRAKRTTQESGSGIPDLQPCSWKWVANADCKHPYCLAAGAQRIIMISNTVKCFILDTGKYCVAALFSGELKPCPTKASPS